jgi:phosphoribosyl 1,2-cyclic phosphodiesterase
MIGFCPLASGSKGNCLYVGTESTKILIDAGLSGKATKERLSEIGVSLDQIDAILITHEHIDHIRGLDRLGCALQIPIFCNHDTAKAIYSTLKSSPSFKIFSTEEKFDIGEITIHPFNVSHDAIDPVAFTLFINGIKLGCCADLGLATSSVVERLKHCDYLYIEANHEPSMVHASARPLHYKQRVLGGQGHLSNDACCALLKEISHPSLKQVYLAHLSSECNNPELALKKISAQLLSLGLDIPVHIAHQDRISTPTPFTSTSCI